MHHSTPPHLIIGFVCQITVSTTCLPLLQGMICGCGTCEYCLVIRYQYHHALVSVCQVNCRRVSVAVGPGPEVAMGLIWLAQLTGSGKTLMWVLVMCWHRQGSQCCRKASLRLALVVWLSA